MGSIADIWHTKSCAYVVSPDGGVITGEDCVCEVSYPVGSDFERSQ